MIVKDEEAVLSRCLESVKGVVDEIVVVDTGSTDETVKIAKRYTDCVLFFPWVDDFSAARNFAFSKATGDYLMWLDADDILPEASRARFPTLRAQLEQEGPDLVKCPYDAAFETSGAPAYTFYRERIIKRSAGFLWQGRVHECIAPRGKILVSDVRVTHLGSEKPRGTRNLHIYQRQLSEGVPLSPRDKFYYGRELFYNKLYLEAVAVLNDMRRGEGWYVNKIEACKIEADCYFACGEREEAKRALFDSFLYGEPRASVCYALGRVYREEKRLQDAAFWYEAALLCRDHSDEGDFDEPLCRTLYPLLELTCVYCELGKPEEAVKRHIAADKDFPEHPSVVHNRNYFRAQGLLSDGKLNRK